MILTLDAFVADPGRFAHHALLLLSAQFTEAHGLSRGDFEDIARAYCGISLAQGPDETFWDNAGRHPDVFIAPLEAKTLKLEDLAPLHARSLYPPTQGRRRLFFIDRCDRMNANAANALLKTLEEPSTRVLFLLTARRTTDVLPTILSRCQKVPIALPGPRPLPALARLESADADAIQGLFARIGPASLASASPQPASLWSTSAGAASFAQIRAAIERAEGLSKRYDADDLRDAIAEALARATAASPELMPVSRFFMKDLRDWKEAQAFNPSSQLWLMRIFLRSAFAQGRSPR